MDTGQKISPAFDAFLADSGTNDKRQAVVVYRVPATEPAGVRGGRNRVKRIAGRSAALRSVEAQLLKDYRRLGSKRIARNEHLSAFSLGGDVLPVASVEVTRETLQLLADQDSVIAVLPNQHVRLLHPRRIEYAELQAGERKAMVTWGLERLEVQRVWRRTKGQGIKVAVIDSGVYADHPALQNTVEDFVVIDPLGRRVKAVPSFDSDQHGTHVCGTIAGGKSADGVAIGVAPRASLLVAAALWSGATLNTVIEAIAWAIDAGARIINMSFGFSYYEPLFAAVFDILLKENGILPVVAIGNENHGNTSSPGNAHNAFSVGAVEQGDRGQLMVAPFSSGASLVFPSQQSLNLVTKPDVVAPGVQVYSSVPPQQRLKGIYEYAYFDGTSMAAPHVSGAAALLMALHPTAPAEAIMTALMETAFHPVADVQRPDNRWGHGLIRPVEALKALR